MKPVHILIPRRVLERCPRLRYSDLEIFIVQLACIQMLELFLFPIHHVHDVLVIISFLHAVHSYLPVPRWLIPLRTFLLVGRLHGDLEGRDPTYLIYPFVVVLLGLQQGLRPRWGFCMLLISLDFLFRVLVVSLELRFLILLSPST